MLAGARGEGFGQKEARKTGKLRKQWTPFEKCTGRQAFGFVEEAPFL